jgi:hypothetical protein
MAISYHEDVVAGTPWVIGGVLYHANDQLLDVTNCSLAWSLLSAAGRKTTSAAEPSSTIAMNRVAQTFSRFDHRINTSLPSRLASPYQALWPRMLTTH